MATEPGNLNAEHLIIERSSYRQIFKATSIFGGVQVFNIIIGIVRVKFVAVLLGTTGVGLMGLLNAPLQLIISITGLGIAFSAVRDISEAHGSADQTKIAKAIITLRRWSWFTGLLGSVVTLTLAPLLSKWTFGNGEYTWAFVWLSITLLLQTLSKGQIAIIQGTRRLKEMAKASIFGSFIGLLTAVPLFYYFGVDGIVPSLIISAITSLLLSWHFSRKVAIEPVIMSFRDSMYSGKSMVKLGIVMTITGIIGFFTGYVLNAFISRTGGVDQVGLYNAAGSVISQSTGLVFAAMTTDYFPRLAEVNKDDSKVSLLVNQQAEMVILILTPILILLISLMPLLIHLFYTPAFLGVLVLANWMILGILIKGLAWPVGFIFPAKGDLRAFSIIEITTMVFSIITNILGYHFFGLEGLGISFVLGYIFGITLNLLVGYKKYGFRYSNTSTKGFFKSLLLVSVVFLASYFLIGPLRYWSLSIVFIVSVVYSLKGLDHKIGLKGLLNSFLNNIKVK